MEFQNNVNLSEHISFKIGGPAKYFYVAKTKKDLIEAVKSGLPLFILGGGSNVLALDEGYDGLVIKMATSKVEVRGNEIFAEAGVIFSDLVKLASNSSLSGLEWAAGIPGTIGGAIYGNAKAYSASIADLVKEVEFLDKGTLEIKILSGRECQFSEKNSVFKKDKNLIILSVVLKLEKGEKEIIVKKSKENICSRKEKQPLDYPSAGSMFINFQGEEPSSVLIDKAGLKGTKVGGAEISTKHAGFIINKGNASSDDVLRLVDIIKKEIKKKHNVELEQEIQIIK